MENSSENYNSNSNILGTNQENLNEYPFQMITKEQEKNENPEINNIDKSENNLKKGENHKNEEDKHNISEIETKTGNNNIKKATNLPIIQEYGSQNKSKLKKKSNKNSLNFLSPEVYMGKKMKHTESNINPIEIKLKRIEEQIKKQLDYDYKKTMKEIQDEFDNKKKNKEKQKHIQEEEQKLKEKLKSMEEFRENKLMERAKKVLIKQSRTIKNLQKSKSRNKLNNKEEQTHSNEDQDEVSNYSRKLPQLTSPNERYNAIIANKKQMENDFIKDTLEILNNLDLDHKDNYIYEQNKKNEKIKDHSKKYSERNELYAKIRMEKEMAKNERILQKDISRRYNIRLAILRDRSEKTGRLKEQAKKKMESFQEKQELLEQKEQEKIKKIMGKINKKKSMSNNYENIKSKRLLYSNLQKENINNAEKEKEQKYNDYLLDQEYYLGVAYDIQNEHNNQKIFQNIIDKHNENEKKYQDFYHFVDNSKKQDINLKPDKIKMKEYKKKIREEIEEKNRKEEEMNK
jgi:hypothetical protein